MKTFRTLSLIICMALIGTSLMAQSNQPKSPRPPMPPRPGKHMMSMLQLTSDQHSKMTDLRLQLEKELLPLRSRLDNLKSELKLDLVSDKYDQRKVAKTAGQIADIRSQMTVKRLQNMRSIRDLLNPDQQKRFDLMILQQRGWNDSGRMMNHHDGMKYRRKMRPMHPHDH